MTQSFTDFVSRGQQSLYQSPQNEIAKLLAQVKQGGGRGQIALRALRSIPGGIEALQAASAPATPTPAASAPPRYTAYPSQATPSGSQQSELDMVNAAAEARIADPREQQPTFIDPDADPNAFRNVIFGLNPIGGSLINLLTPREGGGNRVFTPQVPEGFFGSEENLGKLAPFANAAREVTSPFDVLTSAAIPFGGPAAAAALRASRAGKAGKVGATLIDPISKGGIGKRVAAETGINLAATLGALEAPKLLPEDAPAWQKIGASIGGGLLLGGGALVAPKAGSKAASGTASIVKKATDPIVSQMQKTASEMEGLDLRTIGDGKPVPAAERRQLKGVNEGQIELARGISVPIDDPRIVPSSAQSKQTLFDRSPAGTSIRYETRAGGTRRGVIGSNGEIIPVSNNSPLVGRLNINMIEGSRGQGLEAENLRQIIKGQVPEQERIAQSYFGKPWSELSAIQQKNLSQAPPLKETTDLIAELSETVSLRKELIDSNKDFLDIEDAYTSTDLGKISRGKRPFIDRIRLEVSKGKLDPEVGKTADAFVRSLPDELLKTLGTSFFKLFQDDPRILAGYPVGATDQGLSLTSGRVTGWYESGNALLNIPVNVLESSSLEHQLRVIPHEVAHHLMQFVSKKDLGILEKVYKRENTLEKIKDLSGRRFDFSKSPFAPLKPREYRYESFSEYFAEVIADKVVRDTFEKSLNSNAERTAFAKVMDAVKQVAIAAYNLLIRNGRGDEAERIYRNLVLGEYSPTVKNRMLGRSNVAGMADLEDAAAARGAGGQRGFKVTDEAAGKAGAKDTNGNLLNEDVRFTVSNDGSTARAMVLLPDENGKVIGSIVDFETSPELRRQGFGEALVVDTMEELRRRGATSFEVYAEPVAWNKVTKRNEQGFSPKLFSKLGFELTGRKNRFGDREMVLDLIKGPEEVVLPEGFNLQAEMAKTSQRTLDDIIKNEPEVAREMGLLDPTTPPTGTAAAARQVTPQQQGGVEVGGRAYSAAERKRLTPNIVSQSQGEFFWESRVADPVDNTVDVARSAELTPDVAADLPPITPKSPVAEGAFSTPVGDGKNRVVLESLQDTEIQYNVAFADNLFRKIGEALSPISKYFDPSLAAPESSIGKRLVIVLANLMEEGRAKADRAYLHISRLGTRESIFGAVDDQFRFTEGPFVGRSLNDIVENRAKPDVKKLLEEIKLKETNSETGLPFTALDYVTRLADLDEAGSSFARSYGAEVGFSPEDKVLFASRKVYGKVDSEGNVTQIAFDSGDFPRGFVKGQLEEARVYETARQAEAEGFILIPYDETVKLKIAAVYRLAAEESVSKYVFDNFEFEKIPASKRSIEQKQHELFRGVVGTSRDARALADDFKKAQASHMKKAPESALAQAAQGYIQLGRSYELAGDASLFTIQLLFAIMRDLYYPVYKGETGFKSLPSIPLPGGRSTPSIPSIPLPGGRRLSTPGALGMKTGKQFARDFVIGLGSPDRVRRLSAAALDDARSKLSGSRVIMFQMPGDRTEILEGVGKVEQISNWLEGTARSVPVIGPATGAVAKGLTFPVRRFADAAAEAFGATQNIAGLHLWDAFSPLARNADGSFDPKRLQDVEDTINNIRGLTSTARLGISPQQRWWESMALLAPRYRRAVLNLYKNALEGGVRGDVARQSLIAGFAGVHLTFAALLIAKNKSEGKKWDKDLQESLTPGNSKYFAAQAGSAVLGFGGKTISDIRFMAKMLDTNRSTEQHLTDIKKWVRGQVSFIGQDVFTGIQGRDFEGDPVAPWAKKQLGQDEGGWLSANEWLPNLGKYFAKKPMFIWMQEAALESSSVETKLKVGGTEFIGGRAYEAGKPQLFDEKANEVFGKPYAELNMLERHQLKTDTDVAEQLYEYDLLSAKRGNAYAAYIITNNASRNDTQRRTKTALDEFVKNMLDGEQVHTILTNGTRGNFNGVYSIVNNLRTAVRDAEDEQYISMKEYRKNHGINNYVGKEPTTDFDRMLNAWYDLYEKYEKPAGGLQWDEYNDRTGAKVPGLESAQEAFIKKLSPPLAADLKTWRERYLGVPGVQEIVDLTFTKRIDAKGREVSLRHGYLNNAIWNVIQAQAGYSSEDYTSAAKGNYGPGEPQSYKGQPLPPPLSIYGKPIIKQPAGEFAQ